jgi:hypothetical protein
MRTLRLSIVLTAAVSAGCSTLPLITEDGACTLFQRPGFERPVAVRTATIRNVNAVAEFPTPNFGEIVFASSRSVRVWMQYGNQSQADCTRLRGDALICVFRPDDMRETGFVLSVVTQGLAGDDAKALRTARDVWSSEITCDPAV